MKRDVTGATIVAFIMVIGLFSIIVSCKKETANSESEKQAFNLGVNAYSADTNPAFNLNVVLNGRERNSHRSGSIEFRQNPDTARIITLNTKVFHLQRYSSYILERAVNPITDTTGCSSVAWLKLGKGLMQQSIHTDANGNGEAFLWRNVTAIPRGAAFHIHFQVIDSATSTPVLTSDCYNYAVR